MATDLKLGEKRRGERVLIRIPVQVQGKAQDGREVVEAAETAVVSRFGALIRIPVLLSMGSTLTITNQFSHEAEQFRVAWVGNKAVEGRWDIGVEALNPRDDFWGIRFPPAHRKP